MGAALGAFVRLVVGVVVGIVRMPVAIIPAMCRGKSPPAFALAPSLGAEALDTAFRDVWLTSADGTRLHAVEDNGDLRERGKRPLVFVHGFPELWISWKPQLQRFVKLGHPVLALSLRGYGLSDKPTRVSSYDVHGTLVHDIHAAVQYAQGTGTVDIAGQAPLLVAHDWGAGVCWAYVGQRLSTEQVIGYVSLSNPPTEMFLHGLTGCRQLWASAYIAFFNAPWLPELCFSAGNGWLAGLILGDCRHGSPDSDTMNMYRTN